MAQIHKDEPVLVVSAAAAAVGAVMSVLTTHGVITGEQASVLTQTVQPLAVAAFLLVVGVVARALVTPYAKVKTLLEKTGLLSDADFGRFEAIVDEKFGAQLDPAANDSAPAEQPTPVDAPAEQPAPADAAPVVDTAPATDPAPAAPEPPAALVAAAQPPAPPAGMSAGAQ